jgi:hypothetical protein
MINMLMGLDSEQGANVSAASFVSPSNDDEGETESQLDLMDPSDTKKLEEEHNRTARTDPLYQATPGPDGMYRCPHEKECPHKPTNLKCNYE